MKTIPEKKMSANLSPAGAWAFALGTSIGWGSLVVTSNTYLSKAGPAGSAIGMAVGALIMLLICRSYAYLMNAYPEAGGAYAYVRETFGYDHGFLAAWFLSLTYLAMLWANATSLPLFSRYFWGDIFRFGRMYTLFGYDVYLGEALLSIAAIALIGFLCIRGKKLAARLMLGLTALLSVGIVVCFAAAMLGRTGSMAPAFVPDKTAVSQVVRVACISPWAFIGFENISHAMEEINFKRAKLFRVLAVSVLSALILYIFIMLLSVTAYPPEYDSWLEYIRDLGNLEGIRALPAFYAAEHYLGGFGVTLLMLTLLALIVTSLIGNITALSRLFYALAKDRILPARYAELNGRAVPGRAVLLVAAISAIVPFIGRTAIGWIVDVTTLGATLLYGFVSASAMRLAKTRGDVRERREGIAGLVIMLGFGIYLLVPNLFTTSAMEPESFFLFVVWAVLGFIYFRVILKNDGEKRFGRSIIVWIALLSLVLFVSLVWMSQSILEATNTGLSRVEAYYLEAGLSEVDTGVVAEQMQAIRQISARSILVVVGLFALSLGVLLNNYALMSRKARESETELGIVRDIANTDPLTGVKSKHAYAERERDTDARIAAGTADAFAIVVCDVNGLKQVNDTLGHKAGDEHIRAAAGIVCEVFLHSPVYRTGGDEFVVYLTGRDYENRAALMHTIIEKAEENAARGEIVVASGLSEYDPGADTQLRPVFERADARMYAEKRRLKELSR